MTEVNYRMFPHSDALKIASVVMRNISPDCEVANIAGSIRRCKPEVKDIEIVCIAKRIKTSSVDLFGQDNRKEVVHPDFIKTINSLGTILKGKPEGRMMQILLPEKIVIDLFMPMPYDYWRQFAIRTGSAEYSQKVIAGGWKKIGWCGTENGLRLQSECFGTDVGTGGVVKYKWQVKPEIKTPTLPPVWSSEQEFFDWLGVQYLSPNYRTL